MFLIKGTLLHDQLHIFPFKKHKLNAGGGRMAADGLLLSQACFLFSVAGNVEEYREEL